MNSSCFARYLSAAAVFVALTMNTGTVFAAQYTAPVVEMGIKTCSSTTVMHYIRFGGFYWSLTFLRAQTGDGFALVTQIAGTALATGKNVTGGCTGANGGSGCSSISGCGGDGITYWQLDNLTISQ